MKLYGLRMKGTKKRPERFYEYKNLPKNIQFRNDYEVVCIEMNEYIEIKIQKYQEFKAINSIAKTNNDITKISIVGEEDGEDEEFYIIKEGIPALVIK